MYKNTASQKVRLFFFDQATGLAKTGDAAHLTAYVNGAALADTSASELSSANAPGWYEFDLSQAETNADSLLFTAKSSTSGIYCDGLQVETFPTNLPTAADRAAAALPSAAFGATDGLGPGIFRAATAQAGAAGTITLDASASATTDFYVGQQVVITGGTGARQTRTVTAYNGTTKVATVAPNWVTNPNNTSTFAIIPPNHSLELAVKAKTDTIAGAVTVTGPFNPDDGDTLTIVQGDGYESANRVLTFTFTGYTGPDLTSATGKLRFVKWADYKRSSTATAIIEPTATIGVVSTTVTITVTLHEADTALLAWSPNALAEATHVYQLIVTTAASEDVTFKIGDCIVTRRIDPAP
jgi:hypothetical protein